MSESFDRRIALRRRMLDHLGISLSEQATVDARSDVRATLLACASCGDARLCECWIAQQNAGIPLFCRGRESFLRLEIVAEDEAGAALDMRRRA